MMKKVWKTYVFWILLSEAVGVVSGWLSRDGMRYYSMAVTQPPLSPPPILFPIVWGILYSLMGIGAARIRLSYPSNTHNTGINLFITQLIINFFWSLIFFNTRAYGFAFLWLLLLWTLVLAMTLNFLKQDKLAGYLQIPYLIWLTFAAYLNLGVWYLNR